jgi:ElaB/YqjD/DUF883 family membrane-anchored ribosome-binding protein
MPTQEDTNMSETTIVNREKLMNDLRTVIADAEEVLKVTADQASAGAAELRVRMQERLQQARHRLHDLQENAVARAKAAGHAADDYVHDHPWKAIGAAAGVGLIIGLLIGRR